MKTVPRMIISVLTFVIPSLAWAELSVKKLEQARQASIAANTSAATAAFNSEAKAFSEAIAFSTLKTQTLAKLPGAFDPYLELGFHTFKVNNEVLRNFTDSSSGSTPDFFHGFFLKGGSSLPFGFNVEGGFTSLVSAHRSTGAFVGLSNQVLDFANTLYIDLVPTMTLGGTIMRTIFGPALYSFTAQTVVGAYHRQTLAQFGFIVQYSYTLLVAMNPSISNDFVRYGIMSNLPIYKNFAVKTEIFYPSLSASLGVAYQF